MKNQLAFICLFIILIKSQTIVNPKTQQCSCSNLLNSQNCQSLSGCAWTTSVNLTGNSTNGNITQINTTETGACIPFIQPQVVQQTYCGLVNVTLCAQTIGCAWLNNTCQIFTGCTAYVNTTNALCQAISNQCTTDTTKCIPIAQCSTYTKSQEQCEGNIGSVQPYKCKWIAPVTTNATGTCSELTCKDAPATYTSLKQCQSWISNCLSNGAGCDTTLGTCSTYKVADNCVGRIGSDGNCGKPTDLNAANCVALSCSDAPMTTAYNTDAACVAFQPIKTCVTTQKGCVDSPLPQCINFKKTDTCTDFKGSDGWCTDDTTTATTTTCRALKCSDASFTTNDACKAAIKGLTCISNGLTCTDVLQNCEQYNDTNANCLNYVGLNGKCKGTSSTETAKASCAARVCREALNTLKDDTSCNSYKTGCVTTGAGCTDTLQACNTYTGTATTCAQYKGSDGNCYAPTSQTTDGSCQAKVCSDADKTFTQNTQCQNYSYLCYTNGQGCVTLPKCEDAQLATTCSGNNSCAQVNNVCLGISDCTNFKNQSQCLFNNQIYKPIGSTITYSRKCQWIGGTCSNMACQDIATIFGISQSELNSDQQCAKYLKGCFFNGSNSGGCLDASAPCNQYQGTQQSCQNFKGLSGQNQCINLISGASTFCQDKTCIIAKQQSTTAITNDQFCQQWTATSGCFFNGIDNCTEGDCTTYFKDDCTTVKGAKDVSGNILQCVNDLTKTNKQCKQKQCSDAIPTGTLLFNTDTLCNNWLAGCLSDGTTCYDPTQTCVQVTKLKCSPASTCSAHIIPSKLNDQQKSLNCQLVVESTKKQNCIYNSSNGQCTVPTSCDQYVVSSTLSQTQAQQYCYNLKIDGPTKCWYQSGGKCVKANDCGSFSVASGISLSDGLKYCNALTYDGTNYCSFSSGQSNCKVKSCSDVISPISASQCSSYMSSCGYYSGQCYLMQSSCSSYSVQGSSNVSKAQYCLNFQDLSSNKCTFQVTTNSCIAANTCSDIQLGNTIVNTEKHDVCISGQDKSGQKCVFQFTQTGSCYNLVATCSSYYPLSLANDINKQMYCQRLVNLAGETCNFQSGNYCLDRASPTVLTSCSQYATFQSSAQVNLQYCSKLIVGSGASQKRCGYSGSGGFCKDFACSDISLSNCSSYLSYCYSDGTSCIDRPSTCAEFIIGSGVSDQSAFCLQFTASSKQCVYNSGKSTTNCSEKSCSDIIGGNYQTCQNYSSTCTYDGTGCVESLDCTTITPQGTSDSDKATFCNNLGNGKQCTFITQGSKCVATLSDCTYTIPSLSSDNSVSACSISQNSDGNKCGYSAGQICENKSCLNAPLVQNDQSCYDWFQGCVLDQSTACQLRKCSDAPNTTKTDQQCNLFLKGCLTNGNGCIESTQTCDKYNGDQTQCLKFKGNGILCNNNNKNPQLTDKCTNKVCTDNTTALTNSDCDIWYPSKCIWNGTRGCWDNTKTCAEFQGTQDTCKLYKATDGPCSGTGIGTNLAACYSNSVCTNAPFSFKTDFDCKTWHSNCVTSGFGCIPKSSKCTDIVDLTICGASSLNCSPTGSQCSTRPTSCSSITTAYDCNNLLLTGATQITCGWDSTKASSNCINLTCELLPPSLTTDSQCAARLVQGQCTTTGTGCITKDFCSNYKTWTICQNAKSKDAQGSCTWENNSCRPIKCEDNTVGASDDICNSYLNGCRTNGVSCVSSLTLTCSTLAKTVCIKDGSGNPCFWFQGQCQKYVSCSSLLYTSHSTCQLASPLCTTDGTKCIAIDKCANLTKPSCFVGTDGICGWGQTSTQTISQCQVFSSCSEFKGTNNAECAQWGSKCVSDGTQCIDQTYCVAYLTQTACGNSGTDGKCQWVTGTAANTVTCRLKQCSDLTQADVQSLTTYVGCNSFNINSSTKCNTDGTGCVNLGTCASNSVQTACQVGTDGVCFWETTNNINSQYCRLLACTDLQYTTSQQCGAQLQEFKSINQIECVSNGYNCIPKAACSSYTTKEACSGKGTDGQCAFTPTNSTTSTVGTCKLFSQCSDANSDQLACSSNPSCNFVTNGTSTTCSTHTCATKAQGSICYPIPSFDLATYQICVLSGTVCAAGSASSLTQSMCYDKSVNTYTWNPSSQSCQACQNQNPVNNTINNTNTSNSNNTYGSIIGMILVAFAAF